MDNSSSVQTSAAISRQIGSAAAYRAVPVFAVVDAPDRESTVSNAASAFNDNDIAPNDWLKLLSLKLVFNFLAISSSICLDFDVSFFWNAVSPSVALFNAAVSSLSMLTVNRR